MTIREIAETVARVVGYSGGPKWDTRGPRHPAEAARRSKLEGTGWRSKIGLREGLKGTWYDHVTAHSWRQAPLVPYSTMRAT